MQQANRLPPMDTESERALLGCLLLSTCTDSLPWDMDEVRSIVQARMFTLGDYRAVFRVVTDAHDAGEPIDFMNITPRLEASGECDNDDWGQLCQELTEAVADVQNAPYYARRVREAWRKRELIRAAGHASEIGHSPISESEDIIAGLENAIDAIREGGEGDRDSQTEDDLLQAMENPYNLRRDKVPIALGQLGFLLDGGLDPGSLTIIGARPSCGKTSLGLGLCLHASRASDGCASLFVSVEMSSQQIGLRLLSMRSRIPIGNIRRGVLDEEAFRAERNKAVLKAQAGHPVYILDECSDVRAIVAHAKRHIRHREVRLIVVDYLSLCALPGDYDRHDLRVGAMSKAFKELAVQTGTSVIVMSQLSRASASDNRRPRLSDLRDSGNIEQDADVVVLIHRENDQQGDLCGTTLIIAKQRQGDTGDASVWYRRATMSYEARHLEPIEASAGGARP